MRTWVSGRLMIAVAVVAVAACKGKGRTDYSQSPDSGAVPPAMRIDTSMRSKERDSTIRAQRAKSGIAGDSVSTRGSSARAGVRPADTARKKP